MNQIKVGIVGVGNCASSLIQGLYYYKKQQPDKVSGIMHWDIGGYRPFDIEILAAFDIDERKVGKDLSEAIFSLPNCTSIFCENIPFPLVTVQMGQPLDGFSTHMCGLDNSRTFILAKQQPLSKHHIIKTLKERGVEILLNYLPVGSEQATQFYAECALAAGCAFINNIPVFIASDPKWARRFEIAGLPVIGDDIKSQIGATIVHRTLVDLFNKRGVKLEHTYQLNTGGNTDFLNMLNRDRLKSKKKSKTEAVQAVTANRLSDEDIHIGPSDYVPWQNDNKVCFIRMEGKMFGDIPLNLELRLSVEDSPNSAGSVVDAIRCAKLALDRRQSGVIEAPSIYLFKHPPIQYTDNEAYLMMEAFIRGD